MSYRNKLVAVVTALVLVGSFDANAACNKFVIGAKQYIIQQNNGFRVSCSLIGGGFDKSTAGGDCRSGSTAGSANAWVNGRSFTLRVEWGARANSIGYYTGTINDGGWVENGRTYDEKNPRSWAMWWFDGTPLPCGG